MSTERVEQADQVEKSDREEEMNPKVSQEQVKSGAKKGRHPKRGTNPEERGTMDEGKGKGDGDRFRFDAEG